MDVNARAWAEAGEAKARAEEAAVWANEAKARVGVLVARVAKLRQRQERMFSERISAQGPPSS